MTELPDSDGAVRAWLHTLSDVESTVGPKGVLFELPRKTEPPTNCILMYRIAGTPDEFGKDYPQYTFQCFGRIKYDAMMLGKTLAQYILDAVWKCNITTNSGIIEATSGVDIGPRYMDPQPDFAKRVEVTATFTIRAL